MCDEWNQSWYRKWEHSASEQQKIKYKNKRKQNKQQKKVFCKSLRAKATRKQESQMGAPAPACCVWFWVKGLLTSICMCNDEIKWHTSVSMLHPCLPPRICLFSHPCLQQFNITVWIYNKLIITSLNVWAALGLLYLTRLVPFWTVFNRVNSLLPVLRLLPGSQVLCSLWRWYE